MTTTEGRVRPGVEHAQAAPDGGPGADPGGRSAEQLRDEIAQLHEAVTSRTVLGQATGIVAARRQVSTGTAWQILCRASTDTNTKVRRVAEVVVSSHDGDRPAEDEAIAGRIASILGFGLDRHLP